MKSLIRTTAIILLAFFSAEAQLIQLRTIDIGGQWKAGTAHVSFVPAFSGDTTKPFDGNEFNALEMLTTDTLTVTVLFDNPISIQKGKVFFWHKANWTLECASNLSDLDTKSGTYLKMVDARSADAFLWDSASFQSLQPGVVRLSVKNPTDKTIRLGEFSLDGSVVFTKFVILPQPLKMVPVTTMQVYLKIQDTLGNFYSNFITSPLVWKSSDQTVAVVDEFGKISAIKEGSTVISVQTLDQKLKGSAVLAVVKDFKAPKAKAVFPKVILVLQDPTMPTGSKIHAMFNWRDPIVMANALVKYFTLATDSVVNFRITEIINTELLFTKYYGSYLTYMQYVNLLNEPGWPSLRKASDSGKIAFDYRYFVKYYKLDERRNNGDFDEIWVYTGPFLGMYESQMLGPKAIWWNSPPIKDGTVLTRELSVMGLNYERGVDLAYHSFGHRLESAMSDAYLAATGLNWNSKRANPTSWDLFTRIDKDVPGGAHVGNDHFPPNGAADYDYNNTRVVKSYAENWYRYPFLLDQSTMVTNTTWVYPQAEPLAEGLDQLGYLYWWYNHMPRYEGISNGVLNNWWPYFLDPESAKALAKITPPLGVLELKRSYTPDEFDLGQNYPNPFNPSTTIQFMLNDPGMVTLKVFDTLGREVSTLIEEELDRGPHAVQWNSNGLASGAYYYRMVSGTKIITKRMALIK